MTDPRILGGRYELGDVLGYGGMAEVHLGRDLRLGRDVAVKVLRSDLARDPMFQNRFRREAQSAAQLNHPAIVAVYDTGEDTVAGSPVPYIVMEYVDGSTLRELLRAEGPLTPARALEIVANVCDALDYSHQAGIVHRDIKPGNVMLTRSGQVKVMDFGIARAVAAATATMTQTATVMGTAQYLSPEQARGEAVDARSDIYSTGCLLYELLTGQPPFTGDSPVAVAYQHVREAPIAPSALDPDLGPAVDSIVLKALAKEPANRYQSAAQMEADIERALAGRPVLAQPPADAPTELIERPVATTTVIPPVAERQRRSRRALGWVLLWLLVLAVFVGAFFAGKALIGGSSGKKQVSVPTVTRLPVAQAEAKLRALGLAFKVSSVTSDQPKGIVLNQDPAANTRVAAGYQVLLDVSAGQKKVQVPQLIGLPQDSAIQQLRLAGLDVGHVTQKDADAPAGQVLSARPAPGDSVAAGSKVDLVVASGNVKVPDVKGLDVNAAENKLAASNFQFRVQYQTSTATPGTVLSQSPDAASIAPYKSTVTIFVALQPSSPPTTSPPPPPSTPPPSKSPPSKSPSPTPSASKSR